MYYYIISMSGPAGRALSRNRETDRQSEMKLIAENDTTGHRTLLSRASDLKPANWSNVFPVVRHAREVLQALPVMLHSLFLYLPYRCNDSTFVNPFRCCGGLCVT